MAERKVEIDTSKDTFDFKKATKDQIKARLASVLERGIVSDRLMVDLPAELYGEWVPNSADEVARMQAIGFELDTEYSTKKSLHDHGRVGDVVFMVAPKAVKEVIDEIRQAKFMEVHGKPKDAQRNVQREEREATTNLKSAGVPVINESSESTVTGSEIAAAITNPGVK